MKRKIFSVFFALVLICSFSLVTAVPAGAVDDPVVPDRTTAITNTANRLVAMQSTETLGQKEPADFGWDWIITDLTQHTDAKSSTNIYGVTALGLLDAYAETDDITYYNAAKLTADFLKDTLYVDTADGDWTTAGSTTEGAWWAGITHGGCTYDGGYSFDYQFLERFDDAYEAINGTGSGGYDTCAETCWAWQKADKDYYTSASNWYAYMVVHPYEPTTGAIWWQGADYGMAAQMMGDIPWASDMAAEIKSHFADLDGDSTDHNRFIGWGDAIALFQAVDPATYAADITTLIGYLSDDQNTDGSWGEKGGNPEGKAQDTGYVLIGLAAVGSAEALDLARQGADWLCTNQGYNSIEGGWNQAFESREYSETDSEALQGLYDVTATVTNSSSTKTYYSIQTAIDSASPGDTINVAAGTYSENIVVGKQLILEGAQPGVDPTEEGARKVLADESTVTGAVRIKASDIVVDGFRIEGTVFVDDFASAITDATISNNIITGDSYGIRVGTASNNVISQLIIEYNAIIDNANKGICFWKVDLQAGNLHDVTIRDNTISGNVGGGISTYGAGPYTITGNTVSGNAGNGISIKYDDGDVITGNIVEDNDAMGINMHQVTNCTVEDNTVSGQVSEEVVTTFWGDPVTAGKGSGIYLHEVSTGNTIRYNKITGNNNGILISREPESDGPPSGNSITYNNIAGNFYSGVLNALVDPPSPVDATYNWWDDVTGPEHATLNPGAQGDAVSDDVLFSPWLYETQETIVPPEKPSYAQSVVLDNTGLYAWNTFSTPIVLDDTADTWADLCALTGLNYDIAYRFDLATQKFVNLDTGDDYAITPGEGFFIKMVTAGSLPILYSTAENLILPSRPLTVGFNLIGLASLEDLKVENALFSLAGEGQVVSPTGNVEPGAVLAGDTVYVGEAYWAYMLSDEETLVGFTTAPVNWVP